MDAKFVNKRDIFEKLFWTELHSNFGENITTIIGAKILGEGFSAIIFAWTRTIRENP